MKKILRVQIKIFSVTNQSKAERLQRQMSECDAQVFAFAVKRALELSKKCFEHRETLFHGFNINYFLLNILSRSPMPKEMNTGLPWGQVEGNGVVSRSLHSAATSDSESF